jgi:Fe-S-cluster-containing dehydrogenase component
LARPQWTWAEGGTTVRVAQVDFDSCRACRDCPARKVCRTKALIKMGPDEEATVKPSDCMGCGDCVTACTFGAVAMKER